MDPCWSISRHGTSLIGHGQPFWCFWRIPHCPRTTFTSHARIRPSHGYVVTTNDGPANGLTLPTANASVLAAIRSTLNGHDATTYDGRSTTNDVAYGLATYDAATYGHVATTIRSATYATVTY